MTSKLSRTTFVLAVTAFSTAALCAATGAVYAEPAGSALRIAQNADGGDAQIPNAEADETDGARKARRRDGERPERGERGERGNGEQRDGARGDAGKQRGGDGGGDGGAPKKTTNTQDNGKPNVPKIINAPNAADSIETPPVIAPATKPPVNAVTEPNPVPAAKQITQPVVQPPGVKPAAIPSTPPTARPARETNGVPANVPPASTKTAEPPQNTNSKQPQVGNRASGAKRDADAGRQPGNAAQTGGNPPSAADQRDRRRPRPIAAMPPKPNVKDLNDAKSGRIERREDGGKRVVIVEEDKRQIVKQGNKIGIQKDEAAQLRRLSPNAVVTRDARGRDKTVVERRDNTQVITETDRSGQLLRRYRRDRDGRETVIIDNRRRGKDKFGRNLAIGVGVGAGIIAGAAILNAAVDVPPPRVRVPRDKYIVDYERASEDDVYEALNAPPVDDIDRSYTLDQVRATPYLRDRMRRVDLDDITFETGSWDIGPNQYRKLERIARAMRRVINRNPNEVFLIEGYTDAVGSDVDNLTLSDRRAEAVSVVLTEEFGVPFENLTTQGYGEQYLKIPTDGPERANRRVAARRITPLLNRDISSAPPRPDYDDRRDYDDRGRDDDRGGYDDRRGYDDRSDRYDAPPRQNRWRRYN